MSLIVSVGLKNSLIIKFVTQKNEVAERKKMKR